MWGFLVHAIACARFYFLFTSLKRKVKRGKRTLFGPFFGGKGVAPVCKVQTGFPATFLGRKLGESAGLALYVKFGGRIGAMRKNITHMLSHVLQFYFLFTSLKSKV